VDQIYRAFSVNKTYFLWDLCSYGVLCNVQ